MTTTPQREASTEEETPEPGEAREERVEPTAEASGVASESQETEPTAERPRPRWGAPVVGYVSVGEEERLANGGGYAEQKQAIETFCRERRLRLVEIVRDVEGVSSRTAPAPGLQHACEVLAAGKARGLVVQGLGRLTRSPARLALLLRWLSDADRALVAIDDELDTLSAGGRRTARTLIEVGDWDRERSHRRAQDRNHNGGSGRPAVRDLPELHARIAAMREEGLSLHAIADTLNGEGVPTLRGGAHWRASSVQAAVGYKRPTARTGTTGLTLPEPPPATADEEEVGR
jgi:DNA invertase Pin-like site-specific DNA recombinase